MRENGYYAIQLRPGEYTLTFSHIGYQSVDTIVSINQNTKLDITLAPQVRKLAEVTITRDRESLANPRRLSIQKIKSLPAMAGEVDVLRSFQMLPGVQVASEGNTGLYVRGGSADQTLVYLDGATVYNPSHVYGFLSVFNPEVVKDAVLYKGHIPARYGGRLSAVARINTQDGNPNRFAASGGIGLISSRLKLEGPVIKDKLSFVLAGRRSYADLITKSIFKRYENTSLFFYDTNAKLTYTPHDRHTLTLSAYRGRDDINIDTQLEFAQRWGNDVYALQWNALLSDKLSLDFSAYTSSFHSDLDFDNNTTTSYRWESSVHDRSAKVAFNYALSPAYSLDGGLELASYEIPPGEVDYFRNDEEDNQSDELDTKRALLPAVYLSAEGHLTPHLSAEVGLRYSTYFQTGPGRVFLYQNGADRLDENITDTLRFEHEETMQTYATLEPRVALEYEINRSHQFSLFYNRTAQYLQTVSNFAAGIPYERWVAADRYIRPQIGNQLGLGYFRMIKDPSVSVSLETYYRWWDDQIDLKNNALILSKNNLETELLAGQATAYGAELLVEKHGEPWNGWLSYTWAKAWRQIDGINSGQPYHPTFDRRHNVAAFASYTINDRISVAANWVFASGQATTFPEGITEIEGIKLLYYNQARRNQHRMPDYHRMDLSLTVDGKNNDHRRWQSSWNVSIYNVYARKNPYLITFSQPSGEGTVREIDTYLPLTNFEHQPVMTYLFSIVPSVTYNFRF